jgi:hypothetical protein
MSSELQAGCSTSPRGPDSTTYGFTSSTGVPSIEAAHLDHAAGPHRHQLAHRDADAVGSVLRPLGEFTRRSPDVPAFAVAHHHSPVIDSTCVE